MCKDFIGNEYQFQIFEIVMKVWEDKMLQVNEWPECYPIIFDEKKNGKLTVNLFVGKSLKDEEIQKFRDLCESKFGKNCPPSKCKIEIYHNKEYNTNTRYISWNEKSTIWVHIPLSRTFHGLDYEWYLNRLGKELPPGMLKVGEIICDGKIYRQLLDTIEILCAIQDGVACWFKEVKGCFAPRDWEM